MLTRLRYISGGKKEAENRRTGSQWAQLIQGIRVGDDVALQEMYRLSRMFPAYLLAKSLPACDVEDAVHTVYLVSLEQIRRGDLKEPSRLVPYMVMIARRHVCRWIKSKVHGPYNAVEFEWQQRDRRPPEDGLVSHYPGPDRRYLQTERRDLARMVLSQLSDRWREILQRFYIAEQSEKEIQQVMNLTSTQFRLLKHRAKARAAALADVVLRPTRLRQPKQSDARQSVELWRPVDIRTGHPDQGATERLEQ